MKIDQYFQVKFQETRKVKSKRIQRVLNRTFNPSSSSSDSEDGGENSKKQKKHTDKIPGKTAKENQLQRKKRSHSAETNMDNEEEENEAGVNQAKRPKEDNDKGDACSPTVNRSRGRYRGRGRGRGRARKNISAIPNLEYSVEQTPKTSSSQETGKQLSLENQEDSTRRGRSRRSRPSTSVDNTTEIPVDSVRVNDAQTRRKQRSGSASRGGKNFKSLAEEENSTSDSTDSDDNDEDFYLGPKPVSVFRRGRGRGRGKGSARGRKR